MIYLVVRVISFILSNIPVSLALFLGRIFGRVFYVFAFKKKRVAYLNLKRALGKDLDRKQIKKILKASFVNFAQSIVEALYLSRIDKGYINKYIKIDGLDRVDEALKKKKGVILAASHFGSWEISNVVCAILGYQYNMVFKEQKNLKLNNFINQLRIEKGCRIISRGFSIRDIIKSLRKNEVVGLAMDQGLVEGSIFVDFFREPVPIPAGTLRIALKTQATVIPAYIWRIKGPYHNLVLLKPLDLEGIDEKNLDKPIRVYNEISEGFISNYPQDYLWFYKRWKRSPTINCLILSDGKAGHLSQLKGLLGILKKSKLEIKAEIVEVRFKNKFCRDFLTACALTSASYCQGCLACLKKCLTRESFEFLARRYADMVISCGSSTAAVNLLLKNENQARSVAIMKPGIFSTKRFDLVIAPKHDGLAGKPNVIETDVALNDISEEYLNTQREILIKEFPQLNNLSGRTVSIFLGGPNRNQSLDAATIKPLVSSIKKICEELNLNLLITTSRRTPQDVEQVISDEFFKYPLCKLLVIANRYNPEGAAAGILALSDLIIISSDSISMISEAVSLSKPVVVFKLTGLEGTRHELFLKNLETKNYIKLQKIDGVGNSIVALIKNNTLAYPAKDVLTQEAKIIKALL